MTLLPVATGTSRPRCPARPPRARRPRPRAPPRPSLAPRRQAPRRRRPRASGAWRTEIAPGRPKPWAKFRVLVGIRSEHAGPSRAIRQSGLALCSSPGGLAQQHGAEGGEVGVPLVDLPSAAGRAEALQCVGRVAAGLRDRVAGHALHHAARLAVGGGVIACSHPSADARSRL